ncbi:MAG: MoxR family ATPase [Thermofilaceae archaeon]
MITYEKLKEELKKNGYIIGEELSEALFYALHTEPVKGAFLLGPVGAGKSFLAESIAKVLNIPLFVKQITPQTRETEFFIGHTVDEQGNVVAYDGVLLQIAKFLENNPNKLAVLLIDEIDKAPDYIDSFFLDFLQTGRIRYLGKSYDVDLKRIIIFFTSNQNRPLSDALLRRLPSIYVEKPDITLMTEILKAKGIENEKVLNLALLIYEASLNVELYKPITAQELYQFCKALELAEKVQVGNLNSLDRLIMQFLTKDPHDYELLKIALQGMSSFSFIYGSKKDKEEKKTETITEIIQSKINDLQKENIIIEDNSEDRIQQTKPFTLLSVPKALQKEIKSQQIRQVKYGYLIMDEENSFEFLNSLIDLEKSNKVTNSFKLIKGEIPNKHIFIQKKPFTVEDIRNLLSYKFDVEGEIYVKGSIDVEKDISIKDILSAINQINTNSSVKYVLRDGTRNGMVKLKYLSNQSLRLEYWKGKEKQLFNIFISLQKNKLNLYALLFSPDKVLGECFFEIFTGLQKKFKKFISENKVDKVDVDISKELTTDFNFEKELKKFSDLIRTESGWNYKNLNLETKEFLQVCYKIFENIESVDIPDIIKKDIIQAVQKEDINFLNNFCDIEIDKNATNEIRVVVKNKLFFQFIDFLRLCHLHNILSYNLIKDASWLYRDKFYLVPVQIEYSFQPTIHNEKSILLCSKEISFTPHREIGEYFFSVIHRMNVSQDDIHKSLEELIASKKILFNFDKESFNIYKEFKDIKELFHKENCFSDLVCMYKLTLGQLELLLNIIENALKIKNQEIKFDLNINKKYNEVKCKVGQK